MAKYLTIESGIPIMREAYVAPTNIYEEDYILTEDLSAETPISLPSSGSYYNIELQVTLNGQRMSEPDDYSYVGEIPRTQIAFLEALKSGDVIGFRKDTENPFIVYSERLLLTEDIITGTDITLPNGGYYSGDELQVYLNGQQLTYVDDYLYVGASSPYSKIEFTFDLYSGDELIFRKDREAT